MPGDLCDVPHLRETICAGLCLPLDSVKLLDLDHDVSDGNGYTCDMCRVKASVAEADGRGAKELSLLVKQCILEHADNEVLKAAAELTTEIKMYKDVLPAMERLVQGLDGSGDTLWAHCIGHCDNTTLILEDLKELGYKTVDRTRGLDYPHAALAVRGLARFHAASVALRKSGSLRPHHFDKFIFACGSSAINGFIKSSFEYLHSVAKETWSSAWKEVLENVRQIPEMAVEKLTEISRLEDGEELAGDGPLRVLNHGDPWVNNIMFHHRPDGTPDSIRFVDFQLSHYNSFAFDLHYLLNTSLPAEVIHHTERLYEEYHRALCTELAALGLPQPTLRQLLDELQRTEFFGLFAAVCIAPVVTADPQVEPLKESAGFTLAQLEARKKDRYRSYEYTRRIQVILRRAQLGGAFKRLFL